MLNIGNLSRKINIYSSCPSTISNKNAQFAWNWRVILLNPFAFPGFLNKIRTNLNLWIERVQQRKELSELSDHQLKDIGITRDQAEKESNKNFWD